MFTRRRLLATTGLAVLAAGTMPSVPANARNRTMDIKRSGSQPSGKGPAEYFTGSVRVDPLLQAPDPARVAGAHVTFEPGVEPWSIQVSHGELIRESNDERMILDPNNLMFLYQGISEADNKGDYGALHYKLGLLRVDQSK